MTGKIILPWPAPALWPNFRSRSHWPKTRAAKKARADGFACAKEARVGIIAGEVPVILHATFYPPDRRKRDYDNCAASLKSYADGIADALKVNDNTFRFAPPVIGDVVSGGRVTVTIG